MENNPQTAAPAAQQAGMTATGKTRTQYPKQMVVFTRDGHWKPKYYEVYSRVEERLFRSWAYFRNELFIFRPLKLAMRKEVAI